MNGHRLAILFYSNYCLQCDGNKLIIQIQVTSHRETLLLVVKRRHRCKINSLEMCFFCTARSFRLIMLNYETPCLNIKLINNTELEMQTCANQSYILFIRISLTGNVQKCIKLNIQEAFHWDYKVLFCQIFKFFTNSLILTPKSVSEFMTKPHLDYQQVSIFNAFPFNFHFLSSQKILKVCSLVQSPLSLSPRISLSSASTIVRVRPGLQM